MKRNVLFQVTAAYNDQSQDILSGHKGWRTRELNLELGPLSRLEFILFFSF